MMNPSQQIENYQKKNHKQDYAWYLSKEQLEVVLAYGDGIRGYMGQDENGKFHMFFTPCVGQDDFFPFTRSLDGGDVYINPLPCPTYCNKP